MADFKIRGAQRRVARPRVVLTVLVVAALLVVAWFQRDNIASVVRVLSTGALAPLVAAAVFESARIVLHAYAYTRAFKVINAAVPLTVTVPAWFKAVFMNTVLPSGGTSGMAAVVDAARRRGVAVGSATSATVFTQTCFYSAMFLVVLLGFAVMARSGTLQVRDVLVGLVMGVAALAFVGLLAMGHYAPGLLQRLMRGVEHLVARVCGRLPFVKKEPKPWADNLVRSFSGAATELSRRPKRALAVFGVMVGAIFFDMLAFVASGFAFGITRSDALFCGYVTALVFNSFNVTPGGVGIVEGLASAALAGCGYPVTQAVSAVLVYRAFMYWIPFVIGGVIMYVQGMLMGPSAAQGQEGSGAAGSAAVAVAARMSGAGEPVYLRRRRSTQTLRERLVVFVNNKTELRTVLRTLAVGLCALAGFVGAAFPADPVMVEAVTSKVLGTGPLNPVSMVVCSYLLLVLLPGIYVHDQGNWLVAIVGLLGLGLSTALSGHSVWVTVLVIGALVLMTLWRGCFDAHGFLTSLVRVVRLLAYSVVVAVLYALVGSLFARGFMDPDPGVVEALWLGLQAMVGLPDLQGAVAGPQAAWFFMSVRAVAITLTAFAAGVACMTVAGRVVDWSRPNRKAAREAARAEAEAAAAERRADRRQRWDALRADVAQRLGRQLGSEDEKSPEPCETDWAETGEVSGARGCEEDEKAAGGEGPADAAEASGTERGLGEDPAAPETAGEPANPLADEKAAGGEAAETAARE